jgi:hypothetical protein
MYTGGEYRGVRHDRHFSAASSFQIGRIARPMDVFERNAGLSFAATAFDLQPAVVAIEALRDRGRPR